MPVPSSIETNSAADDHMRVLDVGERRLVPRAHQIRAGERADDVATLADRRLAQGRGDDQPLAVHLDHRRTRRRRSTAAPVFDGSVHGVVVHTTNDAPTRVGSGASTIGNRRNTLGSSTVR